MMGKVYNSNKIVTWQASHKKLVEMAGCPKIYFYRLRITNY
jgi:hypothetical protein